MILRPLPLALAAVLIVTAWSFPASATQYWVDQNASGASDSNDGLSETFTGGTNGPWLTAQRGFGRANVPGSPPNARPAAGDIVNFKSGTYNWAGQEPASSTQACFYSFNSGTTDTYITYRVYPGHTVVLDCDEYTAGGDPDAANSQGSPVFGANGTNWIILDGFRTPANTRKSVAIQSAEHIIVRNGEIDRTPRTGSTGTGNYYCFFVQQSRFVEITGFLCRDSYTAASPGDQNAGGVVNFSSRDLWVHHNDFVNVGLCLDDKEAGVGNLWEWNFCVSNPAGKGMQVTALNATSSRCTAWNCSVQNNTFRHNVFRGDGTSTGPLTTGITISIENAASQDNHTVNVYGNTFYRVDRGMRMTGVQDAIAVYNNIFSLSGSGERVMYVFTAGQPSDFLSNRNCTFDPGGATRLDLTEGGATDTYASWVALGFDAASIEDSDPLFVSASTTVGTVQDFQLQGGSACRNVGNTAPDGSGSTIDAGAFVGGTPGRVAVAPAAAPRRRGAPMMMSEWPGWLEGLAAPVRAGGGSLKCTVCGCDPRIACQACRAGRCRHCGGKR